MRAARTYHVPEGLAISLAAQMHHVKVIIVVAVIMSLSLMERWSPLQVARVSSSAPKGPHVEAEGKMLQLE